jgi:hypothetical protein
MKKPVDIGGGWKAIPVEGGGVIVQAEMGLVAVEWANLDADGKLVNNGVYSSVEVAAPPKPVVPVAGPAAIQDFLDATNLRDLGSDGIYGPLGPTVKKFRDILKNVDSKTTLADTAGDFLLTGDHLRHGAVAALIALKPEQVTVLNLAMDSGEAGDLEHALDSLVVGNVTEEKAALDESKSTITVVK